MPERVEVEIGRSSVSSVTWSIELVARTTDEVGAHRLRLAGGRLIATPAWYQVLLSSDGSGAMRWRVTFAMLFAPRRAAPRRAQARQRHAA